MIAAVAALGVAAVSTEEPVTYVVFPALIWAAIRFGPPGATLAVAITAGVAIGVTANDVGPFSQQPIDHRTLSTQLYIGVAALTTLFLSVVVSERERASRELAEASRTRGRARARGAAADSPRPPRLGVAGPVLDGPAHAHRPEGAGAGGRQPVRAASGRRWARSWT